jgi:transposase-like protein
MKCPHCQQEKVVKNGRSRHGRQRWLCRDCRRTFGEGDLRRHPETTQQQALKLYLEGVGFRGIERLLGVSHVAVMNWVKAQALALAPTIPPVWAAAGAWV